MPKTQNPGQVLRLRHQQEVLVRLSREITNTSSLNDTLRIVLDTIQHLMPFQGGSIALLDGQQHLYIAAGVPPVDPEVRRLRLPLGEGITGWIAARQESFLSPDVDAEARVAPAFRSIGGNAHVKSYLGVPLLTRGHCIGVLQVDSPEANAFSIEHQRLLETVAAQVSGVIENARLLEERRENSRRLQEIYNAASSFISNFDEEFILDEAARRARELFAARYAAAATLDDQGRIGLFVAAGLSPEERAALGPTPSGKGLLEYIIHLKTALRLDEVSRHPAAAGFPPGHPRLRSLLAAPLIARGETLGALYLGDKENGETFTAEDEEMVLILAAGASAAISNARLYGELRHNIEQLYALHQIGQAIASNLTPEEVMKVFVQEARRLCGAEATVISEWSPTTGALTIARRDGSEALLALRERPHIYRQLLHVARTGEGASLALEPSSQDSGRVYGYVAPLMAREQVSGLAEIYSSAPTLIPGEAASLFLTLTAQLSVGIENARLYAQLRNREAQLRRFVERLFRAGDEERKRIAYDIHDGLAQMIVSAHMHLNNFVSMRRSDPELSEAELAKGLNRLNDSLTEARRVVAELRPSTLDDFGLANTLRRHIEQVAAEEGWQYTFKENLGETRLDRAVENAAYRIVQEALTNARKYAQTARAAVELCQDGERLRIQIQDWGQGFNFEEAAQIDGHFGLGGMQERARLLGGWCAIETAPGAGTVVRAELPFYPAPGGN